MKVRKRRTLLFSARILLFMLYYTILSFAVQGETGVADSPYLSFFSVL